MKPFSLVIALACLAAPVLAVPVSITVVGPDNQPLPGAKLSWATAQYTRDNTTKLREQTGVAGVFAWDWDGDFADKRPVGEKSLLRVRVAAPGMAPQFQIVDGPKSTIALQPLRVWSGVVLDQSQKPVAGATLKLGEVTLPSEKDDDEDARDIVVDIAGQTAVTDAAGRWSFEGLPARGAAQLTLRAPNYASQRLTLTLGEGEAAPIFVKPGGAVVGQLLAPDGSPIVGETVEAGQNVPNETVTDAQGRFLLDGFDSGEATIFIGGFSAAKAEKKTLPPYILERFKQASVEAGKTTELGAIKAQKGVLLQARVLGADTKKTLADALFRIGYNTVPNVLTADGMLQTRVILTENRGGFDRPKIESEGYVDYELPFGALQGKGDILDLGTIEMKRGNVIRGTIRIEDAPPGTKAPSISFSRENKYDFVRPKDDGSFASETLEAGSYSVNMNGGNGNWQIVSPRNVSLPAAGVEFKPVEVVIKRLTPVLPLIKTARGRVLDENGQGVAGVTVTATMSLENGNTYRNRTALTDKEGTFTLPGEDEIIGVKIESAEHPNYVVGGATKVEVAEGIAAITGLIARKRGAVYSGHVVGVDGKAAAKAWVVVVEARDYEPVQTDENGDFALPDVPLAEFTLLAAHNRDWAKQAAQNGKTGATLKLQSSDALVDRAQVIEQMMKIKGSVPVSKISAAWDVLGADGIARYLRRNGEPSADAMALFVAQLARLDPAQLLKRAPELLGNSTGETREDMEAQINLVRAAADDAGARTDANAWLDEQKLVKREINPRSVTQLLRMAAVAQKLEREDAAQWLDYAAAVAAQIKGDTGTNGYLWSNPLATLGADAVARFVEGRNVPDEFQLWRYAVPIMARAGDVAGAQKGRARMETLLGDPAMTQAAEQAQKRQRGSPTNSFDRVQGAVAGALAPTDPVAAFEMAQKISDVFVRARAMIGVALGREDADLWGDYAAALARQMPIISQNDINSWSNLIAPLGYENAARFAEVLKPVPEFYFWALAIRQLPEKDDLSDARKVLARLEVLAQMPGLSGEAGPERQQFYSPPANLLKGARQFVAAGNAEADAARALDAIPTTDEDHLNSPRLLKIADRAISAGRLDVAERALRAALTLTLINPRDAGLTASLAERVSPQLGAEFWPVILERAQTGEESWRVRKTIGMWAFYHAPLDPAQSRILVEREWSWRLAGAAREQNNERWLGKYYLHCLQMGMAAVDPARALEMRDEAQAALGTSGADVALATALLSSDAQRARMGAGARF